jgi:hypothetical protein
MGAMVLRQPERNTQWIEIRLSSGPSPAREEMQGPSEPTVG